MSEAENEAPVVVPVEAPVAPEATPVVAKPASSGVVAEIVADVERAVPALEDAVKALVALVKDHRRAGDVDVDNAVADVQAALAAKQ